MTRAKPLQTAVASAAAFTVGAALPLLSAWLAVEQHLALVLASASLVFLMLLGGLAARSGGASVRTGMARVTLWGALAMAMTASVGSLFGVVA